MTSIFIFIKYDLDNILSAWVVSGLIILLLVVTMPLGSWIERYIKKNILWDKVTIDSEKISSSRYGDLRFKEVISFKVHDLNKIFGFKVKGKGATLRFSYLNFLGGDGGKEYEQDRMAIRTIAFEIERVIKEKELNIKISKESTSSILFILVCLCMIILIPGFIFAPQRMIFVVPFVVPTFFYLLIKRINSNKESKEN